MFMKTKLTKTLGVLGICGLSSLAFAGGPDMPHHDLYSGGVGVGVNTSQFFDDFGVEASYTTDELTASFITYLEHNDPTTGSNNWDWGWTAEGGLRDRMGMTNAFLKYGAGVGMSVITHKASGQQNPWFIGPFVGLDYQPLRHVMLSGLIYPVSYGRGVDKTKVWQFFGQGNIAVSYIF